uniref:Uncharacterized protein n=1 Tax=Oryza glumipatula TaxID=40148 RepID=A0A0D9Z7F4_9ORYZ
MLIGRLTERHLTVTSPWTWQVGVSRKAIDTEVKQNSMVELLRNCVSAPSPSPPAQPAAYSVSLAVAVVDPFHRQAARFRSTGEREGEEGRG